MTQEKIMKRRMIRAIVLFVITFVALLVFIGLYIDETRRVQETYRKQFQVNLDHAADSIDSYLNGEGDFDLRYRRILSDISSADSFAFLLTDMTEEHKIAVNELHAALMKYPEQMQEQERMEDMKQAVEHMQQNLDKGFEEAQAIVDSLDKKGY